ncbi:hypothetical protein CK203_080098 [Vitis vinifera]|uniref:PIFI-like Ig-like domain-containing protein n=1 Tax=Vitis vinifera TaxID=29760 RepID=A0A438D9R5_VITVI|nr:hypothetical protein CK203_080098 [Vitis vinifera]
MAATTGSIFASSTQCFPTVTSVSGTNGSPSVAGRLASNFMGASLRSRLPKMGKVVKVTGKVSAAAVATTPVEETKEVKLPSWAMFELGRAPVYWKTMNGLPPSSGEKLKLFYNPVASKLVPNEDFGIGFNGGFNQPIMCGGEPRAMLKKARGKADRPIYTIQICIPKHAVNLIFSFTNGTEWDGPYKLQFQVPKAWRNKPIEFFNQRKEWKRKEMVGDCIHVFNIRVPERGGNFENLSFVLSCPGRREYKRGKNKEKDRRVLLKEGNLIGLRQGLAEELSKEGACDKAIFPDTNIVIDRCALIGNLTLEGGDRCNLDFVIGCTDPSSPLYNPLANVDDGSCPIESDSED